jgi:hypothetical protein
MHCKHQVVNRPWEPPPPPPPPSLSLCHNAHSGLGRTNCHHATTHHSCLVQKYNGIFYTFQTVLNSMLLSPSECTGTCYSSVANGNPEARHKMYVHVILLFFPPTAAAAATEAIIPLREAPPLSLSLSLFLSLCFFFLMPGGRTHALSNLLSHNNPPPFHTTLQRLPARPPACRAAAAQSDSWLGLSSQG